MVELLGLAAAFLAGVIAGKAMGESSMLRSAEYAGALASAIVRSMVQTTLVKESDGRKPE